MELNSALEQLGLLQKKLYAYQTASSSLYLDSVTVAPKDTSEGRGVALGILAGESQKLMTAPETGELLAFLADQKENLSFVEQRQVEELKRSYDRLSRIPADEYMDYFDHHRWELISSSKEYLQNVLESTIKKIQHKLGPGGYNPVGVPVCVEEFI